MVVGSDTLQWSSGAEYGAPMAAKKKTQKKAKTPAKRRGAAEQSDAMRAKVEWLEARIKAVENLSRETGSVVMSHDKTVRLLAEGFGAHQQMIVSTSAYSREMGGVLRDLLRFITGGSTQTKPDLEKAHELVAAQQESKKEAASLTKTTETAAKIMANVATTGTAIAKIVKIVHDLFR